MMMLIFENNLDSPGARPYKKTDGLIQPFKNMHRQHTELLGLIVLNCNLGYRKARTNLTISVSG